MYSLESPRRCDSNEYIQHTIIVLKINIVLKIKKTSLNYHHLLPDLAQCSTLKVPLSGINFLGPKDVRAIEVLLQTVMK